LQSPADFLFTEGIDFFTLPSDASFMGKQRPGIVSLCAGTSIVGTWLDVASGDGRNTAMLLERAEHVVAIDADRSALSKLWHRTAKSERKRLKLLVHNVASALPLPDETVDGALCVGILHYFPSYLVRAVIDDVCRVLKPGGTLLLEFSTDVLRLPVEGGGTPVLRGAEHHFDAAHGLLAEAFEQSFVYEMFEETVDGEEMILYGRPFMWSSRDIHVRAVKTRCQGAQS
jgi:ubiquinone/menaquinone biosynthesis C-methylase UbiE